MTIYLIYYNKIGGTIMMFLKLLIHNQSITDSEIILNVEIVLAISWVTIIETINLYIP